MGAARQGSKAALAELCLAFRPLILKESHYTHVYNALGEDAVNIAWLIFLTFIRRYNGCDYLHLPGLIRCHLRYELLHAVQRKGSIWEHEEPGNAAEQGGDSSDLTRLLQRLSLEQAIATLPVRQQAVIRQRFLAGQPLRTVSKYLQCS